MARLATFNAKRTSRRANRCAFTGRNRCDQLFAQANGILRSSVKAFTIFPDRRERLCVVACFNTGAFGDEIGDALQTRVDISSRGFHYREVWLTPFKLPPDHFERITDAFKVGLTFSDFSRCFARSGGFLTAVSRFAATCRQHRQRHAQQRHEQESAAHHLPPFLLFLAFFFLLFLPPLAESGGGTYMKVVALHTAWIRSSPSLRSSAVSSMFSTFTIRVSLPR